MYMWRQRQEAYKTRLNLSTGSEIPRIIPRVVASAAPRHRTGQA